MAKAVAGLFTEYEFEGDELLVARTFHHLNQMFLQNMRLEAVTAKMNMIVDFGCPEDYFYKQAQLDGQILALTTLIELVPEES